MQQHIAPRGDAHGLGALDLAVADAVLVGSENRVGKGQLGEQALSGALALDLCEIHHRFFCAGHVQPLVLARVVAHILLQQGSGRQEHQGFVARVDHGVRRATPGKAQEVTRFDRMALFVDDHFATARQDVETLFFKQVPVVLG